MQHLIPYEIVNLKAISKDKTYRKPKNGPFGVMFHHFHLKNNQKFGQGSINKNEFEKIIIFLKKNYEILSPQEWLNKLEKKNLKKKDICITFDDALLSQYNIALKILNKYRLKAFWFVYSSVFNGIIDDFEIHRKFRSKYFKNFNEFFKNFLRFINTSPDYKRKNNFKIFYKKMKRYYPVYTDEDIEFRYLRDHVLNEEEYKNIMSKMIIVKKTSKKKLSKNLWLNNYHLKELSKRGHIIGMHAYNHPYKLSELDYESQNNELKRNFNHLKKILKINPVSISYPNGSFNKYTLKIIEKLKLRCGFISNMKSYNSSYKMKFTLRRLDHSNILKNLLGK